MSGLLKPATALMGALSYPRKMIVLSLLFMVPLVVVSVLLMGELNRKVEATNKEQRGLEFIKSVRQIYQHFPQHRGMTNAYLNGASSFKAKILAKREAIKADIASINELEKNSNDIGSVLDVIRSIADQTNLLALNAARAGEHGRGFAVAADEVRTLAGRTQESTAQIQTMIESLQGHTQQAVDVMESNKQHAERMVEQTVEASQSIDRIVNPVGNIMDMSTQVASASEEQSMVAKEIDSNVLNVSGVAHASVAASGEIAIASEELARLATALQGEVAHFKI